MPGSDGLNEDTSTILDFAAPSAPRVFGRLSTHCSRFTFSRNAFAAWSHALPYSPASRIASHFSAAARAASSLDACASVFWASVDVGAFGGDLLYILRR